MKHWGPAFPSTVIFERRWHSGHGFIPLQLTVANKLSVMDLPWTVFVCGSGEEEEVVYQESQVTEELVEEHLVRVVTRDVLDLIGESCR